MTKPIVYMGYCIKPKVIISKKETFRPRLEYRAAGRNQK
jgi:hypothetical protein